MLLIARHGETEWNREERYQGHADPPLNETGRRQAEQLAEELAGGRVDAVYASDLRRASETAEILGRRLDLPVEQEPGLPEASSLRESLALRARLARPGEPRFDEREHWRTEARLVEFLHRFGLDEATEPGSASGGE